MINNFDRILAVEENKGSIIIDMNVGRMEFEKRYSCQPEYSVYYGYDPETNKQRGTSYVYKIKNCNVEDLICDIYVFYNEETLDSVVLFPINKILDKQEKEAGYDTQRKLKVLRKRKGICDYWLKTHCGEPLSKGDTTIYEYPNETVSTLVLEVSDNIGKNAVIGGGVNVTYKR